VDLAKNYWCTDLDVKASLSFEGPDVVLSPRSNSSTVKSPIMPPTPVNPSSSSSSSQGGGSSSSIGSGGGVVSSGNNKGAAVKGTSLDVPLSENASSNVSDVGEQDLDLV
jgi:hypothetical protein